jgi:guanine deaminase
MKTFANTIAKVFYGTLIHSVSISQLEFINQGLLFVDHQGRIAKLVKNVDQDKVQAALDGVEDDKVNFDPAAFPGHISTAQQSIQPASPSLQSPVSSLQSPVFSL